MQRDNKTLEVKHKTCLKMDPEVGAPSLSRLGNVVWFCGIATHGAIRVLNGMPISIAFFKKNAPTPASFSFIFGLFKQTSIQFLQQINVKKSQFHPIYGAEIRTHDLLITPISTRPGLPPN